MSAQKSLAPLMIAYTYVNSPNFDQIDNAIKNIEQNLKEFAALVQATKGAILKSKGANVRELILARDRLEEYRTSTRFDFSNLLRATLQEYLQTYDLAVFRKNLDVIRSTINETNVSSTLETPSVRQLCRGNSMAVPFSQLNGKAGCVEFERQSSYVVVAKRPLVDLPLLVISKAAGTITRSFEQAFLASEIDKLPAPPGLVAE